MKIAVRTFSKQSKMDRHVFISYRRSDAAFVDDLLVSLSGYACWRDTTGIAGGEGWEEKIASAINAAYAMILVVSADTEKSSQVLVEYRLAKAREPKLPIIPLLITKCPVPFNLGNINARLWYDDRDRAAQVHAISIVIVAGRRQTKWAIICARYS